MNTTGAKIFDQNDVNGENVLKPVTLTGTVVPWKEEVQHGQFSDHKLLAANGREYFFVSDNYWKNVLACHVGDEVKVKGLLNPDSGIIVPQLIYPKGPFVQNSDPIDDAALAITKIARRIGKHFNELVIVPAGLLVMLMAL